MRTVLPLVALLLAPLAPALAGAPEVYVDPQIGVDAPGQGTQLAPYRSIRYALTQNPGPVSVQLAPGIYTTPQEAFPLVLGAGDSLRGPSAGGARIVGTGGGVAAPYALRATSQDGPGVVLVEHVSLESTGGSPLVDIDAKPAAPGTLTVQLRDSSLRTNGLGLRLRNTAGVSPPAVLQCIRLDVRTLGQAFDLVFAGGTVGAVSFDGCRITGQAGGVSLRAQGGASGPATVWASANRTVFERCATAIASRSDGNGTVQWTLDHCVFAGAGFALCPTPLVPLPGAIVDQGATVAGNLTYAITRSIFWANWPGCAQDPVGQGLVVDLGFFRAADYLVDRNVLQQPAPPGGWTGTNRTGDPRWFFYEAVGIGSNDYHLLPDSPAIDWGAGNPIGLDFEGDTAEAPCGDGLSDAGVDEYRPEAVWLAPAPSLGEVSQLRLLGPPAGLAVAWAGTPLGGSPCDGSLGILPLFPLAVLVPLDAGGAAERPLAVPATPSLAGVGFSAQAVFVQSFGGYGGLSAVRNYTVLR